MQRLRVFEVKLLYLEELLFIVVEVFNEFVVDFVDLEVFPQSCDTNRIVSHVDYFQQRVVSFCEYLQGAFLH